MTGRFYHYLLSFILFHIVDIYYYYYYYYYYYHELECAAMAGFIIFVLCSRFFFLSSRSTV